MDDYMLSDDIPSSSPPSRSPLREFRPNSLSSNVTTPDSSPFAARTEMSTKPNQAHPANVTSDSESKMISDRYLAASPSELTRGLSFSQDTSHDVAHAPTFTIHPIADLSLVHLTEPFLMKWCQDVNHVLIAMDGLDLPTSAQRSFE